MARLSLGDRLPKLFPDTGVFPTWLDAHQQEVDRIQSDLDDVKRSLQVAYAEGDDLDEIGKDFGQLGQRRDQSDAVYRAFLQSLVQAYGGRGTVDDIKAAVSAGTAIDKSNIQIVEDFNNLEYDIVLSGGAWTEHDISDLRAFAEIGDPAGVELRTVQFQIPTVDARGVGFVVTSSTEGTNRLSSAGMANLSNTGTTL